MIENYSFGKIVVNGASYTDDIKIIKETVIPDWWRKSGHRVGIDDVKDILDSGSDIIVIGTGKFGLVRLSSPLKELLKSKGVELIEKRTMEATKVFNQLHAKSHTVSAGFHLTC